MTREGRRPHDGAATNHTNIAIVTLARQRALVVLLPCPDDAPAAIKEGVARRNIVNLGGTCPCGASMPRPNRAQRRAGKVLHLTAVHEDDCPACDDNRIEAVRGWKR